MRREPLTAPYAVLARPTAQKELDALPPRIAEGIRRVLRELAKGPRAPKFDVKPLRAVDGEPPALRLRVGDYRVIFRVHAREREVRIARIGHRRSVYRGLDSLD